MRTWYKVGNGFLRTWYKVRNEFLRAWCNWLFKMFNGSITIYLINNIRIESFQPTLVLLNPSANRIISAIKAESGTTIDMGRNMLFKLSGSSVLPAYPEKKKKRIKRGHKSFSYKLKRPRKSPMLYLDSW